MLDGPVNHRCGGRVARVRHAFAEPSPPTDTRRAWRLAAPTATGGKPRDRLGREGLITFVARGCTQAQRLIGADPSKREGLLESRWLSGLPPTTMTGGRVVPATVGAATAVLDAGDAGDM